jgi:hypothetical protein
VGMPLRPASTANTAGLGNPFLSLGEDAAALVLTIGAFALPLVALLLVLSLFGGGLRRPPPQPGSPAPVRDPRRRR